jgi:hypothetical protein
MTKKGGWFKESQRHALAAKGVASGKKARVKNPIFKGQKEGTPKYQQIDATYQGAVDHGTIIGMNFKDEEGKLRTLYGDRRMMLPALDGLKKNAPVRIHYFSDSDWIFE